MTSAMVFYGADWEKAIAANTLYWHTIKGSLFTAYMGIHDHLWKGDTFTKGDRLRFSLIHGYQLDRVAAVAGLAKASQLVRVRP